MNTAESPQSSSIPNDTGLLELMMRDSKSAPDIYRPGSYWLSKTKSAIREIKKYGLDDFRGGSNGIGNSFTDNALLDIRGSYNYGIRTPLAFFSRHCYPFNRMFDSQARITQNYFQAALGFKNRIINNSQKVKDLLNKYRLPADTVRGGCLDFCEIGGQKISNHYLDLLDTHNTLAGHVDFSSAKSFFEIGGGFGVNLHILIENYKNIRKYIYLDIPPNLYVGTQYLKSFYGDSIKSYRETKDLKKIGFNSSNELEVFCIAPHQVEFLDVEIDIFQNAHSFVEMPLAIVQNYAKHIERVVSAKKSSIALVSYDGFNLDSTLHPDKLPKLFSRSFEKYEEPTLFDPLRKNFHYIAAGSTTF